MANQYDYQTPAYGRVGYGDASVDLGLRKYMLGIYNYMAIGMAITAGVAYLMYSLAFVPAGDPAAVALVNRSVGVTELGAAIYGSGLRWVLALAPLGIVLAMSFGLQRLSAGTLQVLFWAFAGLMGLSLTSLLAVYEPTSVIRVFLITSIAFGALSLWGYTTKKDLTGWGSFLFMGVIGLIIASIVNLIWPSGALGFAISVIGLGIFAALTAYDTQRLKTMYYEVAAGGETMGKMMIMGALALYTNFINMFIFLLQLIGQNRE